MAARHTHTLTDPYSGLALKLVRYRSLVRVETDAGDDEEAAYVGFLDCRLNPRTQQAEYRAAGGVWRVTADEAVADLLRHRPEPTDLHQLEIER